MFNPYRSIIKKDGLIYKKLLGTASTKTIKGEKMGFLTAILYLTPDDTLCPLAKLAGCMEGCLYTSGRGAFNSVQQARKSKTEFWYTQQKSFLFSLCADIWTLREKAQKNNQKLLVRLNGTSDITWENYIIKGETIFQLFPDIQFYDYSFEYFNNYVLPSKIVDLFFKQFDLSLLK